jgi:hypothetical protein
LKLFGVVAVLLGAACATRVEAGQPIPGDLLVVRGNSPFWVVFQSKGAFDLPDAAQDPTVEGAVLHLNDTSPNELRIKLPPSGWQALGTPPGAKGFRYRPGTVDPDLIDPCRVRITPRKISVRCIRGFSNYSPDGLVFGTFQLPMNGTASVYFTSGLVLQPPSNHLYCASLDGSTAIRNTDIGVLLRDAPPPASCP